MLLRCTEFKLSCSNRSINARIYIPVEMTVKIIAFAHTSRVNGDDDGEV